MQLEGTDLKEPHNKVRLAREKVCSLTCLERFEERNRQNMPTCLRSSLDSRDDDLKEGKCEWGEKALKRRSTTHEGQLDRRCLY